MNSPNPDWDDDLGPEPLDAGQDARNEVRQADASDLNSIAVIDIKSQQFPLSKEELKELLENKAVHATMLLNSYLPAGFALYSIADEGRVLDICRLSVTPRALADGGLDKLVDIVSTKIGDVPRPVLRLLVSENEIGSDLFKALQRLGFKGVGVAPDRFHEYGADFAGIKLERV